MILGSICLCRPKTGKSQLGPAHRARAGRTQAATWAWAGNAAPVRSPAWAAGWPIQSRPSVLIRRPSAHLAEYKTATPRAPEQTLGHFHSVSLSSPHCSLSSFLSVAAAVTERASFDGESEQRAPTPSSAPSPACALPSG